ncbi:hypothetical protein Bca4012_067738 [Brassica carinata]
MKHTKGKQKIEMKRVEDYEDRMATFSKRKAGILKKMNEIITLCDVEASFLVFTETGKPHTFAHPSMEDAVEQVKCSLGHEPSGKDDTNIGSLLEAYKRQKKEELKKEHDALFEELEMGEEKEKKFKESEGAWWNIPNEGLSMEELKRRLQAFVELRGKVYRSGKDGDGSSSDLAERGHCGGDKA